VSLEPAFFLSAATWIFGFSAPDRHILVLACVDRADLIRFVSIGLRQNVAMERSISLVNA